MKKYSFLTFLLCFFIAFTSCNDWLEVEPSDKIDDSKLFSSYAGFRSSLNGIYEAIAVGKLYGREMSWGTASVIGQDYSSGSSGTNSTYTYMQTYDYERSSSKSIQSNMWATAYNAIANCNKLIQEIENKGEDFFPNGIAEKNLILGEALALRGFLHFDMARLFAPAPASNDDGAYVPYHTKFPSYYSGKQKTSELLKKVIADLEKAKDLVASWDTINGISYLRSLTYRYSNSYLFDPLDRNLGEFFGGRGNRLNYVAINGMLARVHLYAGNYPEAKEYAQYIYDHFGPKSTKKVGTSSTKWFKFTDEKNIGSSTVNSNYIKLYEDILFSVYDQNLIQNIINYKGSSTYMRLNMKLFDYAAHDDKDDARAKLIIKDASNKEISWKWVTDIQTTSLYIVPQLKIVPILRLSEVYQILSECLYREGNYTKASEILNEFRLARKAKRKVIATADEEAFFNELLWEYRKEFMTEGQTFFAYKRLNKNFVIGTQTIDMSDKWVFPLPNDEEIF